MCIRNGSLLTNGTSLVMRTRLGRAALFGTDPALKEHLPRQILVTNPEVICRMLQGGRLRYLLADLLLIDVEPGNIIAIRRKDPWRTETEIKDKTLKPTPFRQVSLVEFSKTARKKENRMKLLA